MYIGVSSYAEQNHASISHTAPDDCKRTLENNIIDIFERTKLVFKSNLIYGLQHVRKTVMPWVTRKYICVKRGNPLQNLDITFITNNSIC